MANPAKRRIEGGSSSVQSTGRTTPKGTTPRGDGPVASSRYTPPAPTKADLPSPMWVPALMFTFFGVGLLMIFLNYTNVLPGAPTQWYLLGGLASILFGIITATQYR